MYILNSFFYFVLVEDILWPLVRNRIKVQGFNVMQFTEEYPAARRQIVHWIKEVRVVSSWMLSEYVSTCQELYKN